MNLNIDKDILIQRYNIYIYERIQDLLNSGKNIDDLDYKSDLHKIFEYFSCIKLTQEYNTPFYEYSDIDPSFKEENQMNQNDTGIDACNLIDTIVQCKLRQHSLTWKECATFFGSNFYSDENNELQTRWKKLIITRNQESKLSNNLNDKIRFKHFTDKTYPKNEIISYCKDLIQNPPEHFNNNFVIKKRDYQEECIKLINEINNMNLIICLPTGTGKNYIITHSLEPTFKYLILVPRIILMEQIKDEIIKYRSRMKNNIQLIGDSKNEFNPDKKITICVFNSVSVIKEHIGLFDKIFVDEAHHIIKPEIYKDEENEEEDVEEDVEDVEDVEEDVEDVEDVEEDEENENCDNKTYIKIIKDFSKFNNNIYLSATIDEVSNFKFYKRDIREMIENGYLCDYTINIPIFTEDPNNLSVCEYLIKNYRNIIIYCNSHKDGMAINGLLNSIQNGCSEYIDCNTSRNKRNDIISGYKSGKLPFLVNVKILVEGFDAPITKGVCFMSLPSSSTTLIQIIGRALRLHPEKKIANVILPFSKMEDEKSIYNFMKIMAKNDSRIRKSYKDKKLGGYFNIETVFDEEIEETNLMKEVDIKYELIFNSIGELKNNIEIWMLKLEMVQKYIDENNKLPSSTDKNIQIKFLGKWLSRQKKLYKTKDCIMKDDIIYNKFKDFLETYKNYLLTNEEVWNNNLEKVINFIQNNNKLPSSSDKNKDIKYLGRWFSNQKKMHKTRILIMKDDIIYNKFTVFLETYKEYFLTNKEIWNDNFKKVSNYIDINNKLPSNHNKNKEIKFLGGWLSDQKKKYKIRKEIMKDDIIYNKFKDFLETYKKYFLANEEIWNDNFEKVIQYIKENNKTPSENDKNSDINFLGRWLTNQKTNYRLHDRIMKNNIICDKFKNFLETYKNYLLTNEEVWNNNLEKVINFIKNNNKLPSSESKDIEIKKLGEWILNQKTNYIKRNKLMKNKIIYNKFKNFLEIYKNYLLTNEEVWNNNLEQLIKYININNKLPSPTNKDIEVNKLGKWLTFQKMNYKQKIQIMKNDVIYNKFKDFLELYKDYLFTITEIWYNNLDKVIKYIDENNKLPSTSDKNKEIKFLGIWFSCQKRNYKIRKHSMKDDIIYNKFKNFLETYKINLN